MLKLAVLFFLLSSNAVHCRMENYLKKALDKSGVQQLRNIDFICMINLDEKPEKYEYGLQQLAPYRIVPYQFSAVNGWNLPLEAIKSIGVLCSRMEKTLNFIKNDHFFLPIDMEYILSDQNRFFTVINDLSTLPRAFTNNIAPTYLEKNEWL